MKELIKQAKQGDAEAQCLLGLAYHNGDGLEISPEKAFRWWMKAYYKGELVEQNYDLALYWLKKAYEEGKTEAFEYIKEICKVIRENTNDKKENFQFSLK